jgi:hypothetical protein
MKKRSEVIAARKAAAEKASAAERTEALPLEHPPGATIFCKACSRENAAKDATRRPDGKLECPECGAPVDASKGDKPKDEPEPIPDRKAPPSPSSREQTASEERPKATEPIPPAYCIDCGAEWLRVEGRPFPNCGHTEGFVHDRSKVKKINPPAGHPIPTDTERTTHRDAKEPHPQRPPPFEGRLQPEAPMMMQGNTLHVTIGKMVFRLGDYGVNLTVGPFETTAELAPGADRVIEGAKLLAQLRQMADTAFAEQLAWYSSRLGIIEKKLGS